MKYSKCLIYGFGGLQRQFQEYPDTRTAQFASFDLANSHLGGCLLYWYAGYTLPINTALHEAGYYGDTCDSMTALQKLTLDACSKLKESCGENLRIYLIKYRKQTTYRHKTRNSTLSFDYNYLDRAVYKTYDVSTEADLASRLKDIAEDIKNWAGYEPAKNVE